jgi:hypothetical protein
MSSREGGELIVDTTAQMVNRIRAPQQRCQLARMGAEMLQHVFISQPWPGEKISSALWKRQALDLSRDPPQDKLTSPRTQS